MTSTMPLLHLSRRTFLAAATATLAGCATQHPSPSSLRRSVASSLDSNPIIDLHQHTNYSGRSDPELIAHQANMGITHTILLPAGHPRETASTHFGKSNGLAAQTGPNETCYRLAQEYPDRFSFFANEVPDAPNARAEIEKYLKLGALGIGEQKFNIDVESPAFDLVANLAREYAVPLLIHIQHGMYNHGYARFWRVLEKYWDVTFIGHAQTMWANVSKTDDQTILYPKTPIAPGGWTDLYLRDYENFHADISAGSGLNSMLRDEDHARAFLKRHQNKILYGSDCNDKPGKLPICQGAQTIVAIKRLGVSDEIRRKIFSANANALFGGRCGGSI